MAGFGKDGLVIINLAMDNNGESVDDQGTGWFEVKKVCVL